MNKSIEKRILLFGSIITVSVLILVSFTSVVGFQSNSIFSVKSSPLFNIRTNKAIDDKKDSLNNNYIRKEEENTILLQIIDSNTVILQKLIDKISEMNDNTFNNFIKQIAQKKIGKNKDTQETVKALVQIKEIYNEEPINTDGFTCKLINFITKIITLFTEALWSVFEILLIVLSNMFPSFFPTVGCVYTSCYCSYDC